MICFVVDGLLKNIKIHRTQSQSRVTRNNLKPLRPPAHLKKNYTSDPLYACQRVDNITNRAHSWRATGISFNCNKIRSISSSVRGQVCQVWKPVEHENRNVEVNVLNMRMVVLQLVWLWLLRRIYFFMASLFLK